MNLRKIEQIHWTLVFPTKLRRFATFTEAEADLAKALDRGERAFIQPPLAAWAGRNPPWGGGRP